MGLVAARIGSPLALVSGPQAAGREAAAHRQGLLVSDGGAPGMEKSLVPAARGALGHRAAMSELV